VFPAILHFDCNIADILLPVNIPLGLFVCFRGVVVYLPTMKTHWFLCAVFLLFLSAPSLAQNQVLELDGKGGFWPCHQPWILPSYNNIFVFSGVKYG
jgi:hypothetical protein